MRPAVPFGRPSSYAHTTRVPALLWLEVRILNIEIRGFKVACPVVPNLQFCILARIHGPEDPPCTPEYLNSMVNNRYFSMENLHEAGRMGVLSAIEIALFEPELRCSRTWILTRTFRDS